MLYFRQLFVLRVDQDVLAEGEHDANKQSETVIDYLSFCIDECVPAVKRVPHHDKPWVNGKIWKLLAARHSALSASEVTKTLTSVRNSCSETLSR